MLEKLLKISAKVMEIILEISMRRMQALEKA